MDSMGSSYSNITLRGPTQTQIVETLREWQNVACISPTVNDFTVVFDEKSDSLNFDVIHALASKLSRRFQCPALAVAVYDSDVLCYFVCNNGRKVDEYQSAHGTWFEIRIPTGGDAEELCQLFGAPGVDDNEVDDALLGDDDGDDHHDLLVKALGLPAFSVGLGYRYIQADGVEDEILAAGLDCIK